MSAKTSVMKFWLRLSVMLLLLMTKKSRMTKWNAFGWRAGWEDVSYHQTSQFHSTRSPEAGDLFIKNP
jgi:hypothetical protein